MQQNLEAMGAVAPSDDDTASSLATEGAASAAGNADGAATEGAASAAGNADGAATGGAGLLPDGGGPVAPECQSS